jgi:hypothetical protein
VRDFEVYENDVIVATHGRGFWVIDGIGVLRQADVKLLASDAVLFKPADAIFWAGGGDVGTPVQKDEPQAENAPNGAAIDYYLRTASSAPVTLEILDATGAVVHTFTSAPPAASGNGRGRAGRIPNTTALWRPEPESFAAGAGMHRVVWVPIKDVPPGRAPGGFGRRRTALVGTFTAKLTVNGRSYTQSFSVKPDPRVGALDLDDDEG